MELLFQYGLFLAKIVTVVVAIAVIAVLIVNLTSRKRQRGELRITNLSEQHKDMQEDLAVALLDGPQQKLWHKAQKKKLKQEAKAAKAKAKQGESAVSGKPRAWVLAEEYQGQLRVNCINPGGTRTKMRASAFPTEDALKLKTPADIMPLYLWLMGDDSRRKTGMTFDAQPGRKPGIAQ